MSNHGKPLPPRAPELFVRRSAFQNEKRFRASIGAVSVCEFIVFAWLSPHPRAILPRASRRTAFRVTKRGGPAHEAFDLMPLRSDDGGLGIARGGDF
jgi:hypothetical protein